MLWNRPLWRNARLDHPSFQSQNSPVDYTTQVSTVTRYRPRKSHSSSPGKPFVHAEGQQTRETL